MLKNRIVLCIIPILCLMLLSSCKQEAKLSGEPYETDGLVFKEREELSYADQFTIDRYEGGYSIISTAEGSRYLIVPEGKTAPESIDQGIKVISQKADNIYLTATSAMGLFDALGCGENIKFSGTEAEDWYIDYAKTAMENGDMIYAGKYREPDYELLVSNNCTLSVQSTMIDHSPDVREKLEELGITVFVDYSSYESHPLGRSEWIKVYGEILDKKDEAKALFNEQTDYFDAVKTSESTGKTAVYFYINNSGQAVTRKPGDYITKMIELAGGVNVLDDIGTDSSSASVTMEMEKFYETAKDADFIIYNSIIEDGITSLDELIAKNSLLADFKAVKEGNVWCTLGDLFQETMKAGTVISDFNSIFTGNAGANPPQFLYRIDSEGVQ